MASVRRLVAFVGLSSCLAVGLVACGAPDAAPTAKAYLAAWSSGALSAAGARTDSAVAATAALTALKTDLHATSVRATLGKVDTHGRAATASFTAHVAIRALATWTYSGRLQLVRPKDKWLVHWTVADIHPALTPGTHLADIRALPARAALLDRRGKPLFAARPVVHIGIEPARMAGHPATIDTLARAVGVHDVAGLRKAVHDARPHDFVPVITLRRPAYDAVKSRIYSLPGTVFHADTALLPPATGFGQALLGTVGTATADVLKAAGPAYRVGDTLGLSGLQARFQQRLAGAAGGRVVIEDTIGTAKQTLATFAPKPGRDVATTLDQKVQLAAEAALASEQKPAALVAVRASDGAVLAVANTPDATSYDRALEGHYPPGSTFKVVTTYALLGHGVTPTTPVPCPPTITIGGRKFRNFEGEAAASPPFATDFAISCNTAFIGASSRLSKTDLPQAARTLGVGASWSLPLPAYSGSVPPATDDVELAADAIGQGAVSVSPLTMAMVAAAVDSGTEQVPTLVTNPKQAGVATGGRPLDAARVATLRSLMLKVVQSGTAAGAGLPVGTHGKTGTAEFGTGPHPQTHAWFIGWRGGIAFAVLVEGGGVGGAVAAPIAARFLRAL
ncbi:MAG TPA: penicillin-binding transpeptidase domain-containing protein [Mycobacteriales bacterium]|nr:penicillin-binding transpeptidase domain-containing protein [Mycobacteriales bacterium]